MQGCGWLEYRSQATTYADGYFVSRAFDQLDRLINIKLNGSATNAVVFSYNQLSQRTQLTYSNGATVVYTPQLNEDVTGITHNFVGSNVAFTYGFNLVHEPLTQTVSDSLYMWHPAGAATVTYATADSVNKYPTVGGAAYSYNSNKCLTGDGTWTYSYDTEDHLLTASKTGTSASFVYDPLHRQSQKTVGSTKTRYVYSGWQMIAEYNGTSGTLTNRYVFGADLDEPLIKVTSAGVLTFFHADKMGSIVGVSSATGAIVNKNKFSPFGEITTLAGTIFGFNGQRYDSETGLCYYKNRYLSPKIGRFLQPDPIGYDAGDLNLYAYVGNSPLVYTDPLGLQTVQNTSPNGRDISPDQAREQARQADTKRLQAQQRQIDAQNAKTRDAVRVKTQAASPPMIRNRPTTSTTTTKTPVQMQKKISGDPTPRPTFQEKMKRKNCP